MSTLLPPCGVEWTSGQTVLRLKSFDHVKCCTAYTAQLTKREAIDLAYALLYGSTHLSDPLESES